QLRRIDKYWKRREEIWNIYSREFADTPVVLPEPPEPNTRHAYHLFTLQVEEKVCGISRDKFLDAMTSHHIGVGVHYLSIPEHLYYQKKFGWKPEDYPHAMKIGRSTVSIPISAKLSEKDVNDVIAAVKCVLK
ncbi:MAG: DegT/DnrJ/EryC1/StrS family aminotransferase, partial [Candidatus Omnitrophica bacterium]|nr:DegT/DnrJ/EryC1/StrS family aminotransferase [Candidatus Omnitrophota bacterium]